MAEGNCQICGGPRPPDLQLLCRGCQDNANRIHMEAYYRKQLSVH